MTLNTDKAHTSDACPHTAPPPAAAPDCVVHDITDAAPKLTGHKRPVAASEGAANGDLADDALPRGPPIKRATFASLDGTSLLRVGSMALSGMTEMMRSLAGDGGAEASTPGTELA